MTLGAQTNSSAAANSFNTVGWITVTCCNQSCGVSFCITGGFYDICKRDKRLFYCPSGHSQCYTSSEADKLRDELANTKRIALETQRRLQDEAVTARKMASAERAAREHTEKSLIGTRADRDKIKQDRDRMTARVHAGVCPCCNRSFGNLRRHMETKHPKVAILKVKRARRHGKKRAA